LTPPYKWRLYQSNNQSFQLRVSKDENLLLILFLSLFVCFFLRDEKNKQGLPLFLPAFDVHKTQKLELNNFEGSGLCLFFFLSLVLCAKSLASKHQWTKVKKTRRMRVKHARAC